MSKPLRIVYALGFIGASALLVYISPLHAEFFSNIGGSGGGASPQSKEASARALESLSALMLGLSKLEKEQTDAGTQLIAEAAKNMGQASADFEQLADDQAFKQNLTITDVSADDLAYLENEPAKVYGFAPIKLTTQADVLLLTSNSLGAMEGSMKQFLENPTNEAYSNLRNQVSLLLWIGDMGSKLLKGTT